MLVGERELLGDTDLEPHVRGAELTRFRTSEADRLRIRIDPDDLRRVWGAPERHAAIAAADVDNAFAADQADTAVFSELVFR